MDDGSHVTGAFEGLNRNETVAIADKWAADSPYLIGLILATLVIMTFIIMLTIYCFYPNTCPSLDSTVGPEIEKSETGSYQGQADFDLPPDYSTLVTTTRSSVQPPQRV